jgi:hypothetical protein
MVAVKFVFDEVELDAILKTYLREVVVKHEHDASRMRSPSLYCQKKTDEVIIGYLRIAYWLTM